MRKQILFVTVLSVFSLVCAPAAEPLLIRSSDVRIEQSDSSGFGTKTGFDLYVRKKPGIESVLLTETTKDPDGKADNYAYRATEWNKVNGDEMRFLNGKPLDSPNAKFSLVDSTAEDDPVFGKSFHIYIPPEIVYGYSWSRNGTVTIGRGTFINIRAFSEKYADYRGTFSDNPFMFDLGKRTETVPVAPKEPEIKDIPVLTDDYNPDASEKFHEISDFMIYSKGPDTLIDDIMTSINKIDPKTKADVVFAIDTTGSMKDDIAMLRKKWVPRLIADLKSFGSIRLGLLLYRDYGESGYNYKNIPVKFYDFTRNIDEFKKNLNGFTIIGTEGGDIPEAVYEGLYGSLSFYKWDADAVRKIILIGDAGPHPTPRGTKKYTKALVQQLAAEKGITIDAIILPDDKSRRGR
ncbi:MAG: VWA domain-containing protein [Treponema sp.]|nr:VWA domain-containing protein [Treponema sp.]